jgi:type I restriction enzyme S subunit
MSWPSARIGEVCKVVPGFAFKSADFVQAGIPVIKIANIKDDLTVDLKDVECLPEGSVDEKTKKFFLGDGDIVLAMTGATAGKIGRIKTDLKLLLNQRVAKIEPIGVDADYLWCVLSAARYRERFYSLAGGAAQPNLRGRHIEETEIPLPPIEVQKRISVILTTYDDYLANNRRRIHLLEQSAQLLFKEWFVYLRYPGHEHVNVISGVPEGWRSPSFTDLAEFVNGFAFKPHHWESIGLPIIKIPELKEGVRRGTPRYSGSDVPDKLKVRWGDLLFSWSGTLAIDFWAGEDAYLNQHLFLVKPHGQPGAAFLLLALREALPKFANLSVGATMKHIRRSALEQTRVLVPGTALLNEFEEAVDAIYLLVVNIRRQNAELARARDLLLPRLMDGRLSV